ncbi:hypothetical protein [Rhodococcus sp. ACT016]|uniref:hypothetical protein n=1 Tax=Rhodococcus sp. ACT016 TaxID=3134808 RepID=UPI003D2D6DCA
MSWTTQLPSLFSSMECSELPGTAAIAVRPACSKTFAFHPGAKEGAAAADCASAPWAGAEAFAEVPEDVVAEDFADVLVAAAALADVVVVGVLSLSALPQPTRASIATPVTAVAMARVGKLPC